MAPLKMGGVGTFIVPTCLFLIVLTSLNLLSAPCRLELTSCQKEKLENFWWIPSYKGEEIFCDNKEILVKVILDVNIRV